MTVILASLIAQQTLSEYKVMLGGALSIGLSPVEIKEIVYQAVPYCGIAKVLDFIHTTNDILTEHGVGLPLPGQSATTPENQKHFQRFLSDNCFGDYYTRTGLDIKTRELLTFSMLLSLSSCESQVKGHIQGNAAVGNGKEILLSTVTQLLPYIGYPRALNTIACINEVLP